MTLELNDQEWEVLRELLDSAHKRTIHQLHHSDSSAYRSMLKERIKIVEALISRVTGAFAAPE